MESLALPLVAFSKNAKPVIRPPLLMPWTNVFWHVSGSWIYYVLEHSGSAAASRASRAELLKRANNGGTIFRMSLSGTLTKLPSFCSQPACADDHFEEHFLPGAAVAARV
jgi:hypothetical protein